ncbi:MAG: hypothetical protein CL916_12870 [Deltaproteobacteria bacterium]|nr:hypothetical protein [Deltaproteobacteria bacterium]
MNEQKIAIIKSVLRGDVKKLKDYLQNGNSPDVVLGEAFDFHFGWDKGAPLGPNLLYLSAISKNAEEMVSLLLAAGADPSGKWVYSYEWDAEDCYMYVHDISLLRSLEEIYTGQTKYHDRLFTDGLTKEQIFLLQEHNIIYANNHLPVYENSPQVLDLFREP